MPRFFVDIQVDRSIDRDSVGSVLADREAGRAQAIECLTARARDELPDGSTKTFVATLKTDKGKPIFRATLSFSSAWLEEGSQADRLALRS